MDRSASVLVLTLHSGEPQLDRLRESLQHQDYDSWEHLVFSGLENRTAHQKLYDTIMERRLSFSYFMKLDGDMVLTRPTALSEVVAFMAQRPNVDHVEFSICDWFTGMLSPGIHLFTNRVHWPRDSGDRLFVDPAPLYPGERLRWKGAPAPFVFHAPDPSEEQAFSFGYHRALKAFQPGRAYKQRARGLRQLRVLRAVWHRHRQAPDRRRLLALVGAAFAVQNPPEMRCGYREASAQAYQRVAASSTEELERLASDAWRFMSGVWMRWLAHMTTRPIVRRDRGRLIDSE